jgi:hypothetical protein
MQLKNIIWHKRPQLVFTAVAFGLIAAAAMAPSAAVAAPCPPAITSCGCTITQPNIYTVANDLTAPKTSNPICIEIARAHAILNVKGHALIGSGDGTGILIDRGADHVIVEGGDEADNDPPQDPSGNPISSTVHPPEGKITKWNVGIQDNGDDAVILLFDQIGGNFFQQVGNTTAGVVLNHVHDSVIGDFRASFNGKYGVVLDHSTDIHVDNVAAASTSSATLKTETGILLESSDDNHLGPISTGGNTKVGTWLDKSSDNLIQDHGNSGNQNTGILVGCSVDDKNCKDNDHSDRDWIITGNAGGNKNADILVRRHSHQNVITINHTNNLMDENPHCDSNVWYNNTPPDRPKCK